jgi:hypothetical protein
MPKSYKNRRRRERPIRRVRTAARMDLEMVVSELDIELDAGVNRRLVDEAVALADPWTYSGLDAALPPERPDVRREFFRRRLAGEGNGPTALESLARELAPTPGSSPPPLRSCWGYPQISELEVMRAFRSWRRRLGLPVS